MKQFPRLGHVLVMFMLGAFASCSLFLNPDTDVVVSGLSFSSSNLSMSVGGVNYLTLSITPEGAQSSASIEYSYDDSIISVDGDNNGAAVSAVGNGNTILRARSGSVSAACVVTVSGTSIIDDTGPIITSATSVVETEVGVVKRMIVSLTGGQSVDMASFSWNIDRSTIATVEAVGQNAVITGVSNGIAQLSVTHPAAAYPLNVLVFVKAYDELPVYITTTKNIVSLNTDSPDTTLSVSLVNGSETDNAFFEWEVLEGSCITINSNGANAVVTPVSSGEAVLQVTHPEAMYPLKINVRVTTVIENVYIEPSATKVTVSGSESVSLDAQLKGGRSTLDPTLFQWTVDDEEICSITSYAQNAVVSGLKNGIAKITISHPSARYVREILVFVEDQETGAIDSSMYITTSQNYIRLTEGAQMQPLNVILMGGKAGDEQEFEWKIEDDSIISMTTTNGIVRSARNVGFSQIGGVAYINAVSQGTTTITVSHPDILYPLVVLVHVVPSQNNEVTDTTAYMTGAAFLGIVKGSQKAVSISLSGSTITASDKNDLMWQLESSSIASMVATGNEAILTGMEVGATWLYITHPKARSPHRMYVFVCETEEEIAAYRLLYSEKTSYSLFPNGTDTLYLSSYNIASDEIGSISWTSSDTSIVQVEVLNTNMNARITGKQVGYATVSATLPGVLTVSFDVWVNEPESSNGDAGSAVITGQSLIGILKGETKNTKVFLTGSGVSSSDIQTLNWQTENSSIATVVGNGSDAVISANGNGSAYILVSHAKAQNPHRILVYIAETPEALAAFRLLYTEKTVFRIAQGYQETVYLSSRNISSQEIGSISWQSSDENVVQVVPDNSNLNARLMGINTGTATITASMTGLEPVQITVTVFKLNTGDVYITTNKNVLQFTDIGASQVASITPVGLPESAYYGITWTIDDTSVASIAANGKSATIISLAEGIARITVSHPAAANTITITIRVGSRYIVVNPSSPYLTTSQDVLSILEGGQGVQVTAYLHNSSSTDGFVWTVDDPTIATITQLGEKAFIVPKSLGQTTVTVQHPDAAYDKKVLVLVQNTEEDLTAMPYLTTAQNMVNLKTGTMQNVSVSIRNSDALTGFTWNSDNPSILQIIATENKAVFKGQQNGVARVTVQHSSCRYPLEIVVIVSDMVSDASSSPYITSSQNIVSVTEGGSTKTLSVSLAGGTEQDLQFFTWSVDRTDVIRLTANAQTAVVRGLIAGEARITVNHPKAAYPLSITVISDPATASANLYISPSKPILTLKPADEDQSITATLVGGTAEDKYGFTWYADNYNVIDLTYSANMAIITPRQEGISTITIQHPKAAYDATVTVRVTEYSTFAFAQPSLTIVEGTTQFVSMQVPVMDGSYTGRVVYETENSSVVSITGTNKIAQITAVATGTAIVKATSPSGAKSEMMVYVKKSAEMTLPYITSQTNVISMKTTDSQKSLSATLVGQGVIPTDQYNLSWAVENPQIAQLIGTSGSSVLLRPLSGGETTVKISHPKTDTIYSIWVQVDSPTNGILLGKNYLSLETGKSSELSCTIDNGTAQQYQNVTWTAEKVNSTDICMIMGSGKTVSIYAIKAGRTTIKAEYNGQIATCDLLINASRQFTFNTQSMIVQPGQTKTFNYVLVPDDAVINWSTNTNDYISYTVDTINKTVSVTGISEGDSANGSVTKLTGIANSQAASINITCSWDYQLSIGKTLIRGAPTGTYTIPYEVNPANATVQVQLSKNIANLVVDKANKQIVVTPTLEGDATINVTAKNPANGQTFGNQSCVLDFAHSSITLVPSLTHKTGSFSRYSASDNILYLGDGETTTLSFNIAQANVDWQIETVTFSKSNASSPVTLTSVAGSPNNRQLAHPTDYLEYEYLVTKDTFVKYKDEKVPIVWEYKQFNNDNFYWCAYVGKKTVLKLPGQPDYTDMVYPVYLVRIYDNPWRLVYCEGDTMIGFYSGVIELSTSVITIGEELLATPRRYSIESFKNTGNWYVAAHPWKRSRIHPLLGYTVDSGTCTEYKINSSATLVPILDTGIVSTQTEGVLNVTILRSGARQTFQITVVSESRGCVYNR